ncbi:MAG: glutaredoxin family protein [Rhodocyclaceae bacterium]|jgi:hypothetical protein|nr:glutaredoxin family protein [Rhodocyclaceae bacterium]MBP7081001.1 glutaredoxin family protein [Rhodocyclaceae bacterium]
MLTALETLRGEYVFSIDVIDVDLDKTAESKYDELIPVLTGENGQVICHYYLDETKVRAFLQGRQT